MRCFLVPDAGAAIEKQRFAEIIATHAALVAPNDYINIINGTHPAPQIYDSALTSTVKAVDVGGNMVTWNATNPYPYNTSANATGQAGGAPYQEPSAAPAVPRSTGRTASLVHDRWLGYAILG